MHPSLECGVRHATTTLPLEPSTRLPADDELKAVETLPDLGAAPPQVNPDGGAA